MRLPIKVAPSQIRYLERLLAERIDPDTCDEYTAGRPRGGGSEAVDVNRPLQTLLTRPRKQATGHKISYCECVDWISPLKADREYCALSMEERGVFNRTR